MLECVEERSDWPSRFSSPLPSSEVYSHGPCFDSAHDGQQFSTKHSITLVAEEFKRAEFYTSWSHLRNLPLRMLGVVWPRNDWIPYPYSAWVWIDPPHFEMRSRSYTDPLYRTLVGHRWRMKRQASKLQKSWCDLKIQQGLKGIRLSPLPISASQC